MIATGDAAPISYTYNLDANGVVIGGAVVWGNAELSPQGTQYIAQVYSGASLVWGPMLWLVGPSTLYSGTLYPNIIVTPLPELIQAGAQLTATNFTLSGWGSGSGVTNVLGWDYAHTFKVTVGTGPSANPTVMLVFASGAQANPPVVVAQMVGGTGQKTPFNVTATDSSYLLTFEGTPQPGVTYIVNVIMNAVVNSTVIVPGPAFPSPKTVALAPGGAGNFTVAHGLGTVPLAVIIQMTSGGSIYFQTSRYDGTNLYLTASDAGITGEALVWS